VLFRLRSISILAILLALSSSAALFAQEAAEKKKDEKKPEPTVSSKDAAKNATADQVVESAILIYGNLGGRAVLDQIRKTAIERGKVSVTGADGKTEQANYQKWSVRAENTIKDKIRLDQEFSNARYALIFADQKVFGVFNDSVFTPREDASKAFENQIVRGLEALLRYKENESKIELAGRDKIMGVDFYIIDVTDKQDRKTRFYLSQKTFRVMMLEYEEDGVKYKRKFYNYNYAQGTLVPYRSVLWADGKIVEETDVSTVTFGQKVDDDLFRAS
jgi:hypothetical protein